MTDLIEAAPKPLPPYSRSVLERLGAKRIKMRRDLTEFERDKVWPMMAAAVAANESAEFIARVTGYANRDSVRRIARDHGVIRAHGGDRITRRRAA